MAVKRVCVCALFGKITLMLDAVAFVKYTSHLILIFLAEMPLRDYW